MYYDIFLSNPLVEFEPGPDGVIITMPGNKTGVVYAVSERVYDNSIDLPPTAEGEPPIPVTPRKGFLHCLVTEEQLAKLEEDNFPFKFFDVANPSFKKDNKWPNHVFNPAGCVYKKNGKIYIHRVKADAPEELNTEDSE